MEKSGAYFNENVSPSAPNFNSQLNTPDDIGADPRFVDNGFQNEFGVKSAPPPQQATSTLPSFMPHQPDSNDSYFGRLYKNRRQARSVAGGLILMLGSGLHIGWGIWRTSYFGNWTFTATQSLLIFMIMSWSLGAFLGGFCGSILTPILKKRPLSHFTERPLFPILFQLLAASIFIVGNVVIIVFDDEGGAIAAGRVLTGVGHGVGYVTLITHAGENAAKNMRGTILSIINCMLYTGIFVSVVITGTVEYDWLGHPETKTGDRIVAILSIPIAALAVAASMMSIESVPFLLHQNNHENAKFNLQNLRGSSHETLALAQEMEEFHLMVAQDKRDSWFILSDGNNKPLGLMILMRIMVAMTNNYLINIITISYASQVFNLQDYRLVPLAVVAPRLGMSIVQIFYADVLKRKIQIAVSSMSAGVILVIIGIVLNAVRPTSFGQAWAATVAIAIAGVNSTGHLYAIIFVTGFVVLLLGATLVIILPETRNMSLKQAKDSFINYIINISSPFA